MTVTYWWLFPPFSWNFGGQFIYLFLIEELLYNSALASAIHQHESAISIHMSPPSWTSLLPPTPSHPSRLSQSTRCELPVSYNKFPLAISFTYGNIYVSMLLSQFILPFPSPTVSKSQFSMSVAPLLEGPVLYLYNFCLWHWSWAWWWFIGEVALSQTLKDDLGFRLTDQSMLKPWSSGAKAQSLVMELSRMGISNKEGSVLARVHCVHLFHREVKPVSLFRSLRSMATDCLGALCKNLSVVKIYRGHCENKLKTMNLKIVLEI